MTDEAIIHTTFGDVHVKLFPKECPKAVENFVTHARRGYYNGHCFHRIIKSFVSNFWEYKHHSFFFMF